MRHVEIPLHSRRYPGLVALVDEKDAPLLAGYRWRPKRSGNTFYAQCHMRRSDGKRTLGSMHRMVLGLRSPDDKADHANGNGLDNRRSNLRIATSQQNGQNRRRSKNNDCGWKGVSRAAHGKRWRATIRIPGKTMHLGTFDTAQEAAHAYDAAARNAFGHFARVNFPREGEHQA